MWLVSIGVCLTLGHMYVGYKLNWWECIVRFGEREREREILILDTTSDMPESVSKILVDNWLHSQVVRANCIWQSERRELFAQTIRANIRVSVNTQARTTTRTFARIDRANSSRQCETALTVKRYYTQHWLRQRHTHIIAPPPASGLALKLQRIPTVIG